MDLPIGEIARRSGYAVQTLRYYEQIGLMPKPPRTAGGQRRYDEAFLRRLLFIRHARDLGFDVENIRSLPILRPSRTNHAHPSMPSRKPISRPSRIGSLASPPFAVS